MSRKTVFIIMIASLLVAGVLAAVMFPVVCDYNETYFSTTAEFDKPFTYRNGALFSKDGETECMIYQPQGGAFEKYEAKTFDMAEFGLEGEMRYFLVGKDEPYILPAGEEYSRLYAANTAKKFIYIAPDGKKYLADAETNKAAPLFEGSEEVGIYAEKVTAMSPDGRYFAEAGEDGIVFYERSDISDFVIGESFTVKYPKGFGKTGEIRSFISNTAALVKGDGLFYIFDAEKKTAADCYLDDTLTYSPDSVSRYFAEIEPTKEEKKSEKFKDYIVIKYVYLLSGNEFEVDIDRRMFRDAKLIEVSPDGMYALLDATDAEGKPAKLIYKIKKSCVSLTGIVPETAEATDISFIYNNIILVNFENSAKSYKLCF